MSKHPQRKTRGPQKQHQNLFGEYVDAYCSLLGWDQTQLALHAGMTYSTLNKSTQRGRRASRRTLQRVWLALSLEASIRGGMAHSFVSSEMEHHLYHAAGYATDSEVEASKQALADLQHLSGNQSGLRS